MSALGKLLKTKLSTENLRYFAAEGNASLVSLGAAFVASNYVQFQGGGNETDVLLTYLGKAATYVLVNLGTFYLIERLQQKRSEGGTPSQLEVLARTNAEVVGAHSLVAIITHYAAINSGALPKELAAAVVYPVIGGVFFVGKQVLNHRRELFG